MTRPQDLIKAYQINVVTLKAIAAHFVGRYEFGIETALERLTLESLLRGGIVKIDHDNDDEIIWNNL